MVYTAGLVRSEPHGVADIMFLPDGHMVTMDHGVPFAQHNLGQAVKLQGLPGHEVPKLVALREGINWTLPEGIVQNEEGILRNDTMRLENELVIFWDAPHSDWIVLFGVVFLLIALEQVISKHMTGGYRTHVAMVLGWIACAACYNVYFLGCHGEKDALDWFIGYVLEWMLSIDNLFAFQFIIRTYHCPVVLQHKAIFCGAIGALLSRMLLYFAIGSALHLIHYVQFLFGGFLMYAGIQALNDDDSSKDPRDFWLVRVLKACLGRRLHEGYDIQGHRLFVVNNGVVCATLLVPLIFCVEVTDVIFAVDSVSAKVAQIPNQYIAYSSSVMALLGLRAMFFVIEDLVAYFEALKYGVCFILIFIGSELCISGWFQIPDWFVCVVIVSVFNVCILISVLQKLFAAQSPLDASTLGVAATAAAEGTAPIQPPPEPQPVAPIPQSQAQHTEAPQSSQSSGPAYPQSPSNKDSRTSENPNEQMRKKLAARRNRYEDTALTSTTGGTGEASEESASSAADR